MTIESTKDGRREVYFWPEYAPGVEKTNREAAKIRASVLFGPDQVKDPFDASQWHSFWPAAFGAKKAPTSFELAPHQFLQNAIKRQPKDPKPTTSAFSQWIYSLYGSNFGTDEDRERGKELEQVIFDRRRKAACSLDDDLLSSIGSEWKLHHNGLDLNQKNEFKFFEIDHLRVNGAPLRASPDLLYKNDREQAIIIVEIKHSRLPITTNLWPNVWAQLWCYAQIDVAKNAKVLRVVGEVWGEKWTRARGKGRKRVEGYPLTCLRAAVSRDPRAPAYDNFFRRLFEIYRGDALDHKR